MNKNNSNFSLISNPNKKEEFLFSSKSNKEIILSLIKSSQLSLLSKIKEKSSNSKINKLLFFKQLLNDLKIDLSYILKEKKAKINCLENNINNTKQIIQNKIFKKPIIKENQKKENSEGNELSELKNLNFKIENEIKKTLFMILNLNNLIRSIQLTHIFPEDNIEFSLLNYEYNQKYIEKIYNYKIKQEKELLNKYINLQKQQKFYIDQYKKEIEKTKNKIIEENLVESKNIIYEDTLENITTCNYINNNCNKETGDKNDVNVLSDYEFSNIKIKNNIQNLSMNIIFNLNIKDL